MNASRLLLIDNDPVLCQVLSDFLRAEGFQVAVAHDGASGMAHVSEDVCDLVLLEATLPDLSGIEVLRRIRQQGELPVVILTAKCDGIDRIVSLELGADDYQSKSCTMRELVARLRAILRRTRHTARLAERPKTASDSGLRVFPTERNASWHGLPLALTSSEFDLLRVLSERAGNPVSKADLALLALKREIGRFDRSLDMHISNLRKKLGKLADGRSPIQTVNGSGYQWILEAGTEAGTEAGG